VAEAERAKAEEAIAEVILEEEPEEAEEAESAVVEEAEGESIDSPELEAAAAGDEPTEDDAAS